MHSVVSGHGEVGHLQLGGGQKSWCADRRITEDGGAKALATAFAPVAVDGSLKLPGGAQSSFFTLVWVQILHVPLGESNVQCFTCYMKLYVKNIRLQYSFSLI